MITSRHRAWATLCCVTVVALLLIPIARPGEPQETDERTLNRGRELYQIYCANCHGKRGLGDGPTAAVLNIGPANLTRLATLNGGEFPAQRVHRSIDGRAQIRGHGRRSMPIWGLVFQEYDRDTNQEAEIQFRIRSLVDYLRSIQE